MSTGWIFDIRKYSVHDGPGIRTTVFLKGCPLECRWCHNPESQSIKPEFIFRPNRCIHCGACSACCEQGAIQMNGNIPKTDRELCSLCGDCVTVCTSEARQFAGQEMTPDQVLHEIKRDIIFYEESGGGVTFSGGEPLSQSAFLLELLKACKAIDVHTALDTCGYAKWETLNQVQKYVDLFLFDLKLIDDQEHRAYTGVSNRLILQNLERLARAGHMITIRIPVIPGITDSTKNTLGIGEFLARLPGIEHVDLLPYHKIARGKYEHLEKRYSLPDIDAPNRDSLVNLANQLTQFGLTVYFGGETHGTDRTHQDPQTTKPGGYPINLY